LSQSRARYKIKAAGSAKKRHEDERFHMSFSFWKPRKIKSEPAKESDRRTGGRSRGADGRRSGGDAPSPIEPEDDRITGGVTGSAAPLDLRGRSFGFAYKTPKRHWAPWIAAACAVLCVFGALHGISRLDRIQTEALPAAAVSTTASAETPSPASAVSRPAVNESPPAASTVKETKAPLPETSAAKTAAKKQTAPETTAAATTVPPAKAAPTAAAAAKAAAKSTPKTTAAAKTAVQKPSGSPAAAKATEASTEEEMVWISSTGKRYHSNPSCSGMKNPKKVSLSDAKAMGLTPCKRCH
jgi:hypothetical protein